MEWTETTFTFFLSYPGWRRGYLKVRGQLHAPVAIIPGQVSADGQLVRSTRPVVMDGITSLTVSKKTTQNVRHEPINLNYNW
jgi:hypothetical protein